jgi:excisionase family DNA binding protein
MTAAIIQDIAVKLDRIHRATLLGVKNIFTAEEAAEYCGYSIRTIYRLTADREIPHYKRSGKIFFRREELDDWLTECKVKTTAEIESEADRHINITRYFQSQKKQSKNHGN